MMQVLSTLNGKKKIKEKLEISRSGIVLRS
jgi:hypothetical protein